MPSAGIVVPAFPCAGNPGARTDTALCARFRAIPNFLILKQKEMSLLYIIRETLLMMGFTFVVGIAFAYVLKVMTFFFSFASGNGLGGLMKKSRIWGRAYRMSIARSYRSIWSVTWNDGFMQEMPMDAETKAEVILAMVGMAEYHFGNPEVPETKNPQPKRL